jgi:hypothetical protein
MRNQIQQLKDVQSGKLPMSTLDQINEEKPSIYAWNTDNYASIDHPMLRGVKHVLTTPTGDNVFVKGDVRVHPEAQEYLQRVLGTDSKGPGDGPIGKTAMKLGKEGKGLLLFGSPFHIFQEGLRGIMTGVNPFGLDRIDLASNPDLANGVEHGLTLGQDYSGLSAFKDGELKGNSAIISKIPGLNRVQSGLDHFLFDKYVPSLKTRAYPKLVADYKAAYPDWTDDKIASTAAAHTNELFGGINYQQLGRSAVTQNWAKLMLLAPDWLEGEVRSIARPFGTEGKVARSQMLKATVGLWGTARILNYLTTGQAHNEAPFGVVVKGDDGKEKVYSIRTLPTDALHAISDPLGFVKGRLSPNVHALTQFATGRDDQGHKIAKSGLALDLLNSASPIPLQSAIQAASGNMPSTTTPDQIAKAAGLTVTNYRTEAAKLAGQLASNHNSDGPIDPALLQRHQQLIHTEDLLRAGTIGVSDLQPLRASGQLPEADYKKLIQNYSKTRGMSTEMASLYTRASRAPAADLLNIYDAGTRQEKQTLLPLLRTAGARYVKKQMTEATPTERMADPVLRRYMAMQAQLAE